MTSLWDNVQTYIDRAMSRKADMVAGVVSSYDPKTHSSKLVRQPSASETGFMPHHALHVGNGWGILVGAQQNDQYVVGHLNGDPEIPVILARLFSDQDKPPTVQSGEILLQHQKTNKIFFDAAGNLNIVGSAGASQVVTLAQDGSITIGDSGGATVVLRSGVITCTDKMHGVMILNSGVAYLGNTQNLPYYQVMTTGGNSSHVMATL